VQLRLVQQKEAVLQLEAVNLADKKGNLSLASAELVKRELHAGRIEQELPFLRIDASEDEMRKNFL
jgi:hypothetical protein